MNVGRGFTPAVDLRPTPSCARHRQVSSSSVAKDLGATNTSVAREILRFAQNDSRWRGKCFVSEVLTYGQSEVCYASEVFAKAKVKFRLWRSKKGEGFHPREADEILYKQNQVSLPIARPSREMPPVVWVSGVSVCSTGRWVRRRRLRISCARLFACCSLCALALSCVCV